jgi:hypothetical protein
MIEVTLALGIIAIGVVAVLGLFPVGAAAGRDAIAETYAAEVANQLMGWMEYQFRNSADWTTTPALPGAEPSETTFAAAAEAGTGGTIFAGVTGGTYKVIRYVDVGGTQDVFDDGTDILDFESVVRVWRSDVDIDTAGASVTVPAAYAVQLNIEVSYPFQLPYAARTKSEYNLELFKR